MSINMNAETKMTPHNVWSRDAILGHESAWKISPYGVSQFEHGYDPELLRTIEEKALMLKEELAIHKHLDLTFITGADRYIPEIRDLVNDPQRLERMSEIVGARMEPYPFSIVSSTVTFMGPADGSVSWHGDGVPVTELVPLSISDPIDGGHLEIYRGNCEAGKAMLERGELLPGKDVMTLDHVVGQSTLGQFIGVLHRTAPIRSGSRVTLVMNLRSVEKPFVDDNRLFYLAADNDDDDRWVDEVKRDVWEHQLTAYRRYEREKPVAASARSQ